MACAAPSRAAGEFWSARAWMMTRENSVVSRTVGSDFGAKAAVRDLMADWRADLSATKRAERSILIALGVACAGDDDDGGGGGLDVGVVMSAWRAFE